MYHKQIIGYYYNSCIFYREVIGNKLVNSLAPEFAFFVWE